MSEANKTQVAGNHYQKYGDFQHWDAVVHFGLDYFGGAITKYLFRWRDKGGIQDLRKAAHLLQKYIEVEEAKLFPKGPDGAPNLPNPYTEGKS